MASLVSGGGEPEGILGSSYEGEDYEVGKYYILRIDTDVELSEILDEEDAMEITPHVPSGEKFCFKPIFEPDESKNPYEFYVRHNREEDIIVSWWEDVERGLDEKKDAFFDEIVENLKAENKRLREEVRSKPKSPSGDLLCHRQPRSHLIEFSPKYKTYFTKLL